MDPEKPAAGLVHKLTKKFQLNDSDDVQPSTSSAGRKTQQKSDAAHHPRRRERSEPCVIKVTPWTDAKRVNTPDDTSVTTNNGESVKSSTGVAGNKKSENTNKTRKFAESRSGRERASLPPEPSTSAGYVSPSTSPSKSSKSESPTPPRSSSESPRPLVVIQRWEDSGRGREIKKPEMVEPRQVRRIN